jgi:hypothetical protein
MRCGTWAVDEKVSEIEGERNGKEGGTHQETETDGDLANRTTPSFLQPSDDETPATEAELQPEIATGRRAVKSRGNRTTRSQSHRKGDAKSNPTRFDGNVCVIPVRVFQGVESVEGFLQIGGAVYLGNLLESRGFLR